jgi:hypothetical protein
LPPGYSGLGQEARIHDTSSADKRVAQAGFSTLMENTLAGTTRHRRMCHSDLLLKSNRHVAGCLSSRITMRKEPHPRDREGPLRVKLSRSGLTMNVGSHAPKQTKLVCLRGAILDLWECTASKLKAAVLGRAMPADILLVESV